MLEKIQRNLLVMILLVTSLAGFMYIQHEDSEYIKSFKTGKRVLFCNFKKSGWQQVIPEGFDSETGYYWGNGWSAKNCYVEEK